MQFGIYLVENGILSPDDFVEVVKLSMRSRPQIGALAIQTRRLTCRQVFAVLDAQCDAPFELFGETAMRLGLLTQDDMGQLLTLQSQRSPSLRDLLVDNRFLSPEVVDHHYREYRRIMSEAPRQVLATV